MLAIYKAIR